VIWVTITPDWAAFPSLRCCIKRPPQRTVIATPTEADMHTTISGHHGTHHIVAAAVWILVGIFAVVAFGDALTLLAVALAIVTTVRWIYREVEHRLERSDAEAAPVTHLRPTLTGQLDLTKTSEHAPWRRPRAA
jgi:hypothetical protein